LNSSISLPVSIQLTVAGEALTDHGDSVAKNLSRLRWLDSTVGMKPTVTAPFVPVRTTRRTVKVLGREMTIDRAAFLAADCRPGDTQTAAAILSAGLASTGEQLAAAAQKHLQKWSYR
jgi:hypothetical protein